MNDFADSQHNLLHPERCDHTYKLWDSNWTWLCESCGQAGTGQALGLGTDSDFYRWES